MLYLYMGMAVSITRVRPGGIIMPLSSRRTRSLLLALTRHILIVILIFLKLSQLLMYLPYRRPPGLIRQLLFTLIILPPNLVLERVFYIGYQISYFTKYLLWRPPIIYALYPNGFPPPKIA